MLTVRQRPQAMAPGRRLSDPNQELPFSLAVSEFPFPDAPDPPLGAPLLSDNEHRALDTFFENMTSDNMSLATPGAGFMHSDNWLDLPPQFMGSTTFFGHNPDASRLQPSSHEFFPEGLADIISLQSSSLPLDMPPPPGLHGAVSPVRRTFHMQARTSPRAFAPAVSAAPSSPLHKPGFPTEQLPSADVLEAASVLQNGSLAHSSGMQFGNQPTHNPQDRHSHQYYETISSVGREQNRPRQSPSSSSSSLAEECLDSYGGESIEKQKRKFAAEKRAPTSGEHDNTFRDMMFPPASNNRHLSVSSMARTSSRPELRWGSDQSFNQLQFTPKSEKETTEALERERLKSMECLEVSRSAGTTRPSSPTFDAQLAPLNLKTRIASVAIHRDTSEVSDGHRMPPRKRRKAKSTKNEDAVAVDDAGEDDGYGYNRVSETGGAEGIDESESLAVGRVMNGAGPKPRKRKAAVVAAPHPNNIIFPLSPSSPQEAVFASASSSAYSVGESANHDAAKRRRSGTFGQAKQARENLTEEQKRENHIKSEQKRRTLIKEGFDDLCHIVPSLRGGGFSKSVMLTMAADWLEDLLRGNEALRAQLAQM